MQGMYHSDLEIEWKFSNHEGEGPFAYQEISRQEGSRQEQEVQNRSILGSLQEQEQMIEPDAQRKSGHDEIQDKSPVAQALYCFGRAQLDAAPKPAAKYIEIRYMEDDLQLAFIWLKIHYAIDPGRNRIRFGCSGPSAQRSLLPVHEESETGVLEGDPDAHPWRVLGQQDAESIGGISICSGCPSGLYRVPGHQPL